MTSPHQLVVCLAVLGIGLRAQGGAGPQEAQRFTTRTEAVRVDVLVTHRGRLVQGLTARNFELRDEGVLQQINVVDEQAEPLNLDCLLDTGDKGPANSQFPHLIDAVRALIRAAQPHDRVSLVAFSNRFRILSPLTADHVALESMLPTLYPGGLTAWRDGVFAGLVLRRLDPGRTLLFVLSWGGMAYEWVTRAQLVDAARRTDAVMYVVTYSGRYGDQVTPWDYHPLLDELADETGGRVIFAKEARDLSGTLVNILAEFRSRYVLAYTPTGVASSGWHRLEVTLKGRPGDVKARRGYFAE